MSKTQSVDVEVTSEETPVVEGSEAVETETPVETKKVDLANLPKGISPYLAAKVVNAALAEAGVLREDGSPKVIPPQMMYNYTIARVRASKRPYINTIVVDGKVLVDTAALAAWTKDYVRKQRALTLTAEQLDEAILNAQNAEA